MSAKKASTLSDSPHYFILHWVKSGTSGEGVCFKDTSQALNRFHLQICDLYEALKVAPLYHYPQEFTHKFADQVKEKIA